MRVLVVESLQSDRLAMKKLLQPDFEVITLSSSREAMAFAKSHSFDVVLIPVTPDNDLDSISLLNDLNLIHPTGFVALAVTGVSPGQSNDGKLFKAGFSGTISKPFDKEKFRQIIHEAAVMQRGAA